VLIVFLFIIKALRTIIVTTKLTQSDEFMSLSIILLNTKLNPITNTKYKLIVVDLKVNELRMELLSDIVIQRISKITMIRYINELILEFLNKDNLPILKKQNTYAQIIHNGSTPINRFINHIGINFDEKFIKK